MNKVEKLCYGLGKQFPQNYYLLVNIVIKKYCLELSFSLFKKIVGPLITIAFVTFIISYTRVDKNIMRQL